MTSLLAPVTQQTDANLLHRMMQCLATKIKIICTINPKILSLVYTLSEGSTLHALGNAVLMKALGPKCIGHLKMFMKPA